MKLQKVWLPILIVLLIIGSAIRIFATKTVTVTRDGKRVHQTVERWPFVFGLDIRGGLRAVLQADVAALPKGVTYNPTLVQQTLENRVNASGVSEATVQPKGNDQFIVELPDVHDKQAILNRLGTTAQMKFYNFQDAQLDPAQGGKDLGRQYTMHVDKDSTGHGVYSFTNNTTRDVFRDGAQIQADFTGVLQKGTDQRPGAVAYTIPEPLSIGLSQPQVYFTPDQQKRTEQLNQELQNWQQFINAQPVILTGSDGIQPTSRAQMGGNNGLEPIVTQEFTDKGSRAMAEYTSEHVGDYMGIVLDDRVLSAPVIQSEISDQGEISGGFNSLKEADDLAGLLNAGALPVPLKIVQVESVEASLGKGAVSQSLKAGLAGLILVLIFMAIWYKIPGILADVALLIYALFTLAIYKGVLAWTGASFCGPVTLTLPGIAGFILSIGMAVDANILIFERMKEELAHGKAPRAAIDAGFNRAFPAIRDSNICTIITCLVLLSMGTPSVRGFATTLLWGVLVSLFSAITVTRTLLFLLVEAGHITNPAQLGYRPRPAGTPERNFNIIGKRRAFYTLSLLIIVPGLIAYLGGGLKKSIEFTGGSQIEVKYNRVVTQDQVLAAARAGGITDPLVQMAEGGTIAIVSTPERTEARDLATGENILQEKLEKALGPSGALGMPFTLNSFDKVDPIISNELTQRAIQAVAVASTLIVLYLALVFSLGGFVAGLRLGTSAIIALLHDVLVLLGVFSILGATLHWKIDSLFVTAMLTVIGFSVHDTVVIFDRVRENLRHRIKGENFEQLVNRSVNQTLNRSLRTSGTVLMTLFALMVFGGHTTLQLNVALFIGILSGTYSSICNAASILVDWENWLAKRRAAHGVSDTMAVAAAGATAASNGGSARPIARPTVSRTPLETGSGSTGDDSGSPVGISQTKAKKKKPARRF